MIEKKFVTAINDKLGIKNIGLTPGKRYEVIAVSPNGAISVKSDRNLCKAYHPTWFEENVKTQPIDIAEMLQQARDDVYSAALKCSDAEADFEFLLGLSAWLTANKYKVVPE